MFDADYLQYHAVPRWRQSSDKLLQLLSLDINYYSAIASPRLALVMCLLVRAERSKEPRSNRTRQRCLLYIYIYIYICIRRARGRLGFGAGPAASGARPTPDPQSFCAVIRTVCLCLLSLSLSLSLSPTCYLVSSGLPDARSLPSVSLAAWLLGARSSLLTYVFRAVVIRMSPCCL